MAPVRWLAALAVLCVRLLAQDADPLARSIVRAYADSILASYEDSLRAAERLRDANGALVGEPTEARLEAARARWIEARDVYGTTEVFRFQDGPIDNRRDGVETWLNAWPIDESYIDRVAGA